MSSAILAKSFCEDPPDGMRISTSGRPIREFSVSSHNWRKHVVETRKERSHHTRQPGLVVIGIYLVWELTVEAVA